MSMKFRVGDRVRLSDAGIAAGLHPHSRSRRPLYGDVVSVSLGGRYVTVRRHGLGSRQKRTSSYAAAYWDLVARAGESTDTCR